MRELQQPQETSESDSIIVFKFFQLARPSRDVNSQQPNQVLTAEDTKAVLTYWLRMSQLSLSQADRFEVWSQQLGLFKEENGLWRCGGRLKNSEVSFSKKHPVFLNKDPFDLSHCHNQVMHGGYVDGTEIEVLDSERTTTCEKDPGLHRCVICCRFQAAPSSATTSRLQSQEGTTISLHGK